VSYGYKYVSYGNNSGPDRRPDNILCDEHLHAKICDFGAAHFGVGGDDATQAAWWTHTSHRRGSNLRVKMAGSPGYTPPDMNFADLAMNRKWDAEREVSLADLKAVDVFGFGVLASAFCTHNKPYSEAQLAGVEATGEDLFECVARGSDQGGLRPIPKPDWPSAVTKVVIECVKDTPRQRPTFQQLREGLQREVAQGRLPPCEAEAHVPSR